MLAIARSHAIRYRAAVCRDGPRSWSAAAGARSQYTVYVRQTIAIRADAALRDAIAERAAAQGKTISAFVREVLEQAVEDRPLQSRAGHLRGALDLSGTGDDAWRNRLREPELATVTTWLIDTGPLVAYHWRKPSTCSTC